MKRILKTTKKRKKPTKVSFFKPVEMRQAEDEVIERIREVLRD